MLIVFPVSASDGALVPNMIKVIERLGANGLHTAVVVSTPTAIVAAQQLHEGIKGMFSSVDLKVLEVEPLGGWPQACNIHFRETARLIHEDPKTSQSAWYWFELDNTPLKRGWVETLHQEYVSAGLPFMGCIHPTHFVQTRDDDNNPLTFAQQDSHMVGTGIYPNDLWERSILIHYMVQPFDVEMQYEIVPNCHHTNLIQHNWSSGSYRRNTNNNKVVCKALHAGRSPVDHALPVSSDAVVLHGCKDGSLAEIVLRKRNLD
jgi:hypothetical protein|tara:strand:+ start:15218 stop:16000 length:783 start_codon:yes stop_codon:yes gene_type:complete